MEAEFKPSQENGSKAEETKPIPANNEVAENKNGKKSRKSRSITPQLKKEKKINRKECEKVNNIDNGENNKSDCIETTPNNENKDEVNDKNEKKAIESTNTDVEKNDEELFSLKLNDDEPEPELQFDDNSDSSFQTDSPIVSRCATRRSQIKSVSTPKTPKSLLFEENKELENDDDKLPSIEEKSPIIVDPGENLLSENDSICTSTSNLSSKAVVGSDSTRLNFTEEDSKQTSLFINASKDQSVTETLRCLSSRKPINERGGDIRKLTLKSNQRKCDLNDYSIERITGIKRKECSETPKDVKRFKGDSSSFFNYLASPLSNLKQRFWNGVPSSTPKLTAFKNKDISFEEGVEACTDGNIYAPKESWCSLM